MTAVILEDERPASEKLKRALADVCPGVDVVQTITSVTDAVHYFRHNSFPDIMFMDIALSDGNSFKLFEQVNVTCPVIFTTAYDAYWQKAFEHNSIDYLLKPIRKERLLSAVVKYRQVKDYYQKNYLDLVTGSTKPARRFLVKKGNEFVQLEFSDIAYFYASRKLVFLVQNDGRKLVVHQTLQELEEELDSLLFRRVNRKFIVQQHAIRKIRSLAKSRLALELEPATVEAVIVSHENGKAFREWLEGRPLKEGD